MAESGLAGDAMKGMLSCQGFFSEICRDLKSKEEAQAVVSWLAVRQADALIEELDRGE